VDIAQDTLLVIKASRQDMHSISGATGLLSVTIHYLRLAEHTRFVLDAWWAGGGHRWCTLEEIAQVRRLGAGEERRHVAASDG
jgi:hypothetical protein